MLTEGFPNCSPPRYSDINSLLVFSGNPLMCNTFEGCVVIAKLICDQTQQVVIVDYAYIYVAIQTIPANFSDET